MISIPIWLFITIVILAAIPILAFISVLVFSIVIAILENSNKDNDEYYPYKIEVGEDEKKI